MTQPPKMNKRNALTFLGDSMPDQNDYSNIQSWPFWWWPKWMADAIAGSGSTLAPQLLDQPILPGWTFGNVVSVTETNSGSPETERDIVARHSYGRQLGRVIEAVEVLIRERPEGALKSAALDDLLSLGTEIDEIKSRSCASRVKRIEADLARLKKDNPEEYRRIVSGLMADAQVKK